jgi:hypothetical protein
MTIFARKPGGAWHLVTDGRLECQPRVVADAEHGYLTTNALTGLDRMLVCRHCQCRNLSEDRRRSLSAGRKEEVALRKIQLSPVRSRRYRPSVRQIEALVRLCGYTPEEARTLHRDVAAQVLNEAAGKRPLRVGKRP